MGAKTMTTKEVAAELETDPKTLRKFLRSEDSGVDGVGQGKRYEISAQKVRTLKKAFVTWAETHQKANVDASTE